MGISSSSLNAFAQEYENYGYEHEEEYDSYDPHQSEKKNDKSGSEHLIANCDNNNEINIGINQEHSVTTQDDSADTTTLNGQALEELTAEEAMNGLLSGSSDGTGEPLLNLERNIVNVCFTNNDSDLTTGDFVGGAQASGTIN